MFGWFRRQEGFEWREYVRTTVLVKRRDRQRRIDEVREAALKRVEQAGDRGLEAGRAGINLAGQQAKRASMSAGRAFAGLFAALSAAVRRVAVAGHSALARELSEKTRAVSRRVGWRPSAMSERQAFRRPASGVSFSTVVAEAWASLRAAASPVAEVLARSPVRPRHVAMAVAALVAVYAGGPMLRGETPFMPSSTVLRAGVTAVEFSGRARAVNGDTLRLAGRDVRLAGIEAPAQGFPCVRANGRRWGCGNAAKAALDRLARGAHVVCSTVPGSSAASAVATCRMGDHDFGLDLVRGGYAFATGNAVSGYQEAEREAQASHAGVWQGNVVRPEAWRVQVWDEAKRTSPNGCPIKGVQHARTYALPWSPGYDSVRVRLDRGDQWFCSEDDARAAGYSNGEGA